MTAPMPPEVADDYGDRNADTYERRLRCGFVNCDRPAHPSGSCADHADRWADLARILR
jgi:hypothetical protein